MVVVINEEYLKDKTQEFDVETIFTLSLNGLGKIFKPWIYL